MVDISELTLDQNVLTGEELKLHFTKKNPKLQNVRLND